MRQLFVPRKSWNPDEVCRYGARKVASVDMPKKRVRVVRGEDVHIFYEKYGRKCNLGSRDCGGNEASFQLLYLFWCFVKKEKKDR